MRARDSLFGSVNTHRAGRLQCWEVGGGEGGGAMDGGGFHLTEEALAQGAHPTGCKLCPVIFFMFFIFSNT